MQSFLQKVAVKWSASKSFRAVEIARERAAIQKVNVEFRIGDALQLHSYFSHSEFDSVVDSGLFHSLMDEERGVYVQKIDWVLRAGGSFFMLCLSDKEKRSSESQRISKPGIEKAFSHPFRLNYIRDTVIRDTFRDKGAKGYITYATKEQS
jgi:cyclopropane fatty-acyl-phospholipid synthase-like methyltransferase